MKPYYSFDFSSFWLFELCNSEKNMRRANKLTPAIIPLFVGGCHLLHDTPDAYPTALQLMLLSCITEVLVVQFGLYAFAWLAMSPLLFFGGLGPIFSVVVGAVYARKNRALAQI